MAQRTPEDHPAIDAVVWRAVTKRIPDYLKLHTETDSDPARNQAADNDVLTSLGSAFETATGWRLNYDGGRDGPGAAARPVMLARQPVIPNDVPLVVESPIAVKYRVERDRATALAEMIGRLVEELLDTRDALRHREAELAAGIPVVLQPSGSQHLAERLEAVLRGGAEMVGCQAAALYMLDDATSNLKLRACWGLPKSRLADPPRPLRGAMSDLEALVGHAVALEDASILPHWKVPEDFPAALCVPVSSANTPLGTLWFFCGQTREFTNEQTHLAEIIAGRLVSDLEREVLANEQLRLHHGDEALRVLARFQDQLAPSIPPLIDGWQVAGRTLHAESVGGDFHDWFVLPDGRLAVVAGRAVGDAIDAALTATLLQAAARAHASHRHDARQMLDHLNESLWTGSTGDRFAAIWYGLIDPECGSLQFAAAGDITAVVQAKATNHMQILSGDHPLLGSDPDHHYLAADHMIKPGESLILYTPGICDYRDNRGWHLAADCLDASTVAGGDCTAEERIDAIFRAIEGGSTLDRTVVVTRHLF